MESNDELKEIDVKNRTCYYFNYMIEIEGFDLDNILADEKSYKNVSVYNISYKSLIDSKPLRIRFEKTNGFIRVYGGTRYLLLFGSKKDDFIYNRIRHVISVKGGITYAIFHNYAKIKIVSYDSLPLKSTVTFHNVKILIKSVWNKDKSNYYYNMFLKKASYRLD